jgi:hypothetical protein
MDADNILILSEILDEVRGKTNGLLFRPISLTSGTLCLRCRKGWAECPPFLVPGKKSSGSYPGKRIDLKMSGTRPQYFTGRREKR